MRIKAKKKAFLYMLLFFAALSCESCSGDGGLNGASFRFVDVPNHNYSMLIGLNGDASEVLELPSEHNGFPVTMIGSFAFKSIKNVKEIVLPKQLQIIGSYAFADISSLERIVLPFSLHEIGGYAFANTALTSLHLPKNVSEVNPSAFDRSPIGQITVEEDNEYYTDGNCNALIKKPNKQLVLACKNTTVSEEVSSIKENAFRYLDITSIRVPSSVRTIEKRGFRGCEKLEKIRFINNSFYESGPNQDSIISKEDHTLLLGPSGGVIADGVEKVEEGAFVDLPLHSLSLSSSVSDFNIKAIEGCEEIESIEVAEGNLTYDSREGCNALIRTEDDALLIGSRNTVLPQTIKSIESNAFFYVKDWVKDLVLPDAVTAVGQYAFCGSRTIESIVCGSALDSIHYFSFYGCENLSTIRFNNNLRQIGRSAFDGCKNISSLSFPNSLQSIYPRAFAQCEKLKEIRLPSSIIFCESPFSECPNITKMEFSEGTEHYENANGLLNGTSVESVVLPSCVTKISSGGLESGRLSYVYVPKSVSVIESGGIKFSGSHPMLETGAKDRPVTWFDDWVSAANGERVDVRWGVETPSYPS